MFEGGALESHKPLYGNTVPSDKEHRVIELVAAGLKNKDIGVELGTTEYVIKNHLRVIYDKLGFWNRVELALWYESRRQGSINETAQ